MTLIVIPVIDIAIAIYGFTAPRSSISLSESLMLAAAVFSSTCFWLGLLLAVQVALLTADKARKTTRFGIRATVAIICTAVSLYHLLYWSFVLMNDHFPSREALAFVMVNALQIPHHLLQTARLATVSFAAMGFLLAILILQIVLTRLRHRPLTHPRRDGAYAAVMLTAWYVTAGVGTDSLQVDTTLLPAGASEDRARQAIESLPTRRAFPELPNKTTERPSVVVVLVESLRHDLLTDHPEAVPFLRTLHENHTGFSRAYATASHSNLSNLAFWYSQYPLRGPGKEGFPRDADWRGVSLFEVFHAHGYQTAYLSSQNERWGDMINWLETSAIDHFFHSEAFKGSTWENYDDIAGLASLIRQGLTHAGKVEDSETLALAKKWIHTRDRTRPFFIGMNLQNTHFSYVLTPGAAERYQPSNLEFRAVYYRWPESQKVNVRNRYLNSAFNIDDLLRDFVDYLKSEGIWDEIVFVVVGDSGEAFYEHGFGNHSGPMYEEVARTLAVMKTPVDYPISDNEIARPVSHIDIAATIPSVVGIPLPWSFQGRPVTSSACKDRPVFFYSNAIVRQYGVVSWPWKYLLTTYPSLREELYNLERDPMEKANLTAQQPEVTAWLEELVRSWSLIQHLYYQTSAYLEKAPPDHCKQRSGPSAKPHP